MQNPIILRPLIFSRKRVIATTTDTIVVPPFCTGNKKALGSTPDKKRLILCRKVINAAHIKVQAISLLVEMPDDGAIDAVSDTHDAAAAVLFSLLRVTR